MRFDFSRLSRNLAVAASFGLGTLAWLPSAQAYDPAANAEVRQLLDIGWQTSIKARGEADQKYASSVRAGGGFSGDYAYFLVLLQQRRYNDALKHSESLVKHNAEDPVAWRANLWSAAMTRNYQQSFAASGKFAEVLAKEHTDSAKGTAVREHVAFLGRMYGFFGGPAGEQVKQEERKAAEKQVVEKLGADLRPDFEAARDAVLDQFLGLTNKKADEKEKAIVEGEAQKAQTLDDLAKSQEKIDGKKDELKSDVARADAEFKQEIDDLNKKDAPLAAQLGNLQARFLAVESTLAGYVNQIAILQQRIRNEKDQNQRNFLQNQITNLDLAAIQVRGQLNALDGQIAVVQSQRAALANQANALTQRHNGQLAQANKAASDLAKQEKKNDNLERITKGKNITGNTSKVSVIDTQAGALSTYQPFPLEQEKLRLLEALK